VGRGRVSNSRGCVDLEDCASFRTDQGQLKSSPMTATVKVHREYFKAAKDFDSRYSG